MTQHIFINVLFQNSSQAIILASSLLEQICWADLVCVCDVYFLIFILSLLALVICDDVNVKVLSRRSDSFSL